ncbi:EPIPL protein, partial [Corythaixoides concolor]|nr:EPIPL protein [Corythaixoides concolor]
LIAVKTSDKDTVSVAGEDDDSSKEEPWKTALKTTVVDMEMSMDESQGRQVSVWDLLFSDYIPKEKRQELLELYRAGTLTIQELVSTTGSIVTDSKE